MLEIFQYWQVNLVFAIMFIIIFNQFYRLVAKKAEDTASMLIIIFSIVSLVFIFFIPFFEIKFPVDWKIYALLFVAICFYTVNDRFKSLGYKHLDVSEVSVLTQLSRVFMIAYGIFIFGECLNLESIVGSFFIIMGGILVTFNKGVFVFNKYAVLMIVSAFAFATALVIDVGISEYFNLAIYLLIICATPAIIIFFIEHKSIKNLKEEFNLNKESKKYYFITGVSFALAALFYLAALRQGQISVVAPLSSVVVFFNVLAGYIFLKERKNPVKRIISAILVIIGVFLLV